MNSATVVLLSCLLILCAQAQPHRSKKCKCLNGSISHIKLELLRKISVPVFHKPSSFCPQLEIIIVLENKVKCVNPESPLGKLLQRNKSRQEIAALTTTRATVQQTQEPQLVHDVVAAQ
ncbi:C-X-C motif chemokine 10-like [Cynoglossus semilaevis]|uniref:C-X-C motif chemokine 10-like n=1 Tax=Cynoglossus semilaevis TaxID=244447 RepID=A0A3P8VFG7_CYNSE|nr:C-X-C motif chemokine 10-like [Cynoglossus semilaevis]